MASYITVKELALRTNSFINDLANTQYEVTLNIISLLGALFIPLGCIKRDNEGERIRRLINRNGDICTPPSMSIAQCNHYNDLSGNELTDSQTYTKLDILIHIRNSFAHGLYEFESNESSDIVNINLKDENRDNQTTFEASITPDQLIPLTQTLLDFFIRNGAGIKIKLP